MKRFKYIIDSEEYTIEIGSIVSNIAQVIINGENFSVELEAEPKPERKPMLSKPIANGPEEESQPTTNVNIDHVVKAPPPGIIIGVLVHVGGEVKTGDTVVVLGVIEVASNIEAERDGKVMAICIKQGESVMEGTPLVVIE